jgi:tripartite-type tricarboxylate transporter receptor subunit TctC
MVVNPSFPAQTISEFIAYAKAHPAKINMGSAGYGSAPHMFGELFKMMTGIDLVHIPYRDSYWPDLLAGQTQILFAPVISATGYVQSGQLRALAVTTRTRLKAMPAIPALDRKFGLKRFLAVRRSWCGSRVAYFWVTSFRKKFIGSRGEELARDR